MVRIQVPRIKLGSQGLEVSRLGLGCGGLSGIYNAPLPHEEGINVIKQAFSMGITLLDTSDVYGDNYHNEIMIGKALKQLPSEEIQLTTDFGCFKDKNNQYKIKGDPDYVRKCCEGSLMRLGIEYIDLYYVHRVDTSVPIEDAMGELKKLMEEGKIKYVGLCEASIDTVRRAHAVHPITAVQMEFSLLTRDIEDDIIPLCRELGIGIVAYSPLGRGFFGGKAVVETLPTESVLQFHPRYVGENLEKNKALYHRFAALATKYGCTPPQLALAWALHQGDDIVPIPGTTKIRNLENNAMCIKVKLSKEDLEEICKTVSAEQVAGDRDFAVFTPYNYKAANTPAKQ